MNGYSNHTLKKMTSLDSTSENKLIEETKRTFQAFWKIREKKMKENEENDSKTVKAVKKETVSKNCKKSQPVKTEKQDPDSDSEKRMIN